MLIESGAQVQIVDIINYDANQSSKFNLAVLNMSAYKTYESLINNVNCPVTSLEWVEDCLIQKTFFWPNKQLINKSFLTLQEEKNQKLKINDEALDQMIETLDSADKQF